MRCSWLLGILTGCGYISQSNYDDRIDVDDDNVSWLLDCNDEDPYIGGKITWYIDNDGDGFGNAEEMIEACEQPEGAVGVGTDCNDEDATIYPGAVDAFYDGIDSNCDEANDCDADEDGYDGSLENGLPTEACPNASDCDDTDPAIYPDPSLSELFFNGEDDDCNFNTGDGDADGDGFWHVDYIAILEARGLPTDNVLIPEGAEGDCYDSLDLPVDGFEAVPLNEFSWLTPADVNPSATERYYDGIDQNCAGDAEADFDQDGDGFNSMHYNDATGVAGSDCVDSADDVSYIPSGITPTDVNPDATEIWYDGIDQNCAGDDDFDGDKDGEAINAIDCDGDGVAETSCDFDGDGVADFTAGSDCNDSDSSISPAAEEEISDGIDQNCDTLELCYQDSDFDGYGSDEEALSNDLSCTSGGFSTVSTDCDDDDSSIFPGATESPADGVDQNCDNVETCYVDSDGDGYGSTAMNANGTMTCSASGESSSSDDCDDADDDTYPGAAESDSATDCMTDTDGDGYGELSPAASVVAGSDCDDTDPAINPAASEIDLDGVDQDCNGFETCYQDSDGDGYGSGMISSTTISCIGPGVSLQDGDCNDGDINIYPWASEDSSDPADQNCDGMEASGYVTCDSSEDAGVYYLFCADLTTWDSADNDCAAHGYDGLSSVLSSTENDFLIANLPDSTEMWIGYSDQSAEGTFEWSDGSVMGSYTAPWGSGEPNDTGGSEDCAALNSSVHTLGEWDDFDCSSTFTFVCASR